MVNFIAMYYSSTVNHYLEFFPILKDGKTLLHSINSRLKEISQLSAVSTGEVAQCSRNFQCFQEVLKTQPLCSSSTGDEARALCLPSVCCVP